MKALSLPTRTLCGAFLAVILALRVLSPAGFMPAFDHGAVTIVVCPDAQSGPPVMAGHHQGHSKALHQPCPYAAGSATGPLGTSLAPLVAGLILAAPLLLGRTFVFIERNRAHERPPLRGPPLPA